MCIIPIIKQWSFLLPRWQCASLHCGVWTFRKTGNIFVFHVDGHHMVQTSYFLAEPCPKSFSHTSDTVHIPSETDIQWYLSLNWYRVNFDHENKCPVKYKMRKNVCLWPARHKHWYTTPPEFPSCWTRPHNSHTPLTFPLKYGFHTDSWHWGDRRVHLCLLVRRGFQLYAMFKVEVFLFIVENKKLLLGPLWLLAEMEALEERKWHWKTRTRYDIVKILEHTSWILSF